jgi:hypothetical protein
MEYFKKVKAMEIIKPISLAAVIIDKQEAYEVVRQKTADPIILEIEAENFMKCSEIIEIVINSKQFNN